MSNVLLCNRCEQYLPPNNFYPSYAHKKQGTCKKCLNKMKRDYVEEERSECCGSKFVPNKPNHYRDEYQKECVFQLLPILGYEFCEETGIWWKKGWKDKNGNFSDLKPYHNKFRNNKLTPEVKHYIIEQYLSGMRMTTIARKTKLTYQTIRIFVRKYEESTDRRSRNTE